MRVTDVRDVVDAIEIWLAFLVVKKLHPSALDDERPFVRDAEVGADAALALSEDLGAAPPRSGREVRQSHDQVRIRTNREPERALARLAHAGEFIATAE